VPIEWHNPITITRRDAPKEHHEPGHPAFKADGKVGAQLDLFPAKKKTGARMRDRLAALTDNPSGRINTAVSSSCRCHEQLSAKKPFRARAKAIMQVRMTHEGDRGNEGTSCWRRLNRSEWRVCRRPKRPKRRYR